MQNNVIITIPSSELRALGREGLYKQWPKAIAGIILYMAVVVLPVLLLGTLSPDEGSSLEAFGYTILMTGPFTLGYSAFAIGIFRRYSDVSPSWVFSGWNRTFKSIGLFIWLTMILTIGFFFLIIPGIYLSIRYSQVFYIFADHPDWSIPQIMKESSRMMRGNCGKYFCLQLSFIGWIFLAAAAGGVVSSVLSGILLPTHGSVSSGIAALAAVPSFSDSGVVAILYCLCVFSGYIGYFFLAPYTVSTAVVFYDMLNGNLRPKNDYGDRNVISRTDDGFERTNDYLDAAPVGSRAYEEMLEDRKFAESVKAMEEQNKANEPENDETAEINIRD